MKVLLLSLYDEWCLGLRLLSSLLKQDGHEVHLAFLHSVPQICGADGNGDPEGYDVTPASLSARDLRALVDLVRTLEPQLVGISLTSNFTGLAERVTQLVRTVSKAPVVWGGVDPTANPDVAIATADVVCVGEGEGATLDLVRALASGSDYSRIANLWVRRADGSVVKNAVRPLVADLDSLPFADFDTQGKYWISGGCAHHATIPDGSNLRHAFPIIGSRGCVYACSYCCNSMYRELYGPAGYCRLRSVENVVAEIERYVHAHPETDIIEFWDDVFGYRQDWVERFAEVYPKRVGLPFWCYTYPALCKPAFVSAVKRAGVCFLVMGLQSGSTRTLHEDYGRRTTASQALEAARIIHEAGIPLVVDLILGNPFETEEDHLATLEMMLALPPGFMLQEINHLTLYRNYPLTRRIEVAGIPQVALAGRNAAQSPATADSRFWHALLSLTQFPMLGADTLRVLARDPHLRAQPDVLVSLASTLLDLRFVPGTRVERTADLHQQLRRVEDELSSYKGSRAVQLYFRLKRLLGSERGRS